MAIMKLGSRFVGDGYPPLVIAEIGINHGGDFKKAKKMIKDAYEAGVEAVKFQLHIPEEEMLQTDLKPGNSDKSIWEIITATSLTIEEHWKLKEYAEKLGLIYLNTPFSKAAVDILEEMGVVAYKIGSGEANNYPLVKYIASKGRPVILSTGMNDINSISKSVEILRKAKIEYALLHCVSIYPTPYNKVHLGAMLQLKEKFPDAVIGISDHSIGNYIPFAAVALGALIIEKHFTSDKSWPGPDIPVSIDPSELKDLVFGVKAIYQALGGKKEILSEEKSTIEFAYASVVSIRDIKKGEILTEENIWVKRPGTGEILAKDFYKVLGKRAKQDIPKNTQLKWEMIDDE